jgi:Flp pilus assembly pilin Flp
MNTLTALLGAFFRDEDGLTATEYAILFVIVLAVIVTGVGLLRDQIERIFGSAVREMQRVP